MRFQPPFGFARYPSSTGNRAVSTASREAFASEHHSPFPASTCRRERAGHALANRRRRRAPPLLLCARTPVAPLGPGCGRSRPDAKFHHSPLMVLALIVPFGEDYIFFEKCSDYFPHVVSMMSSIFSESLAHLCHISDVELMSLILQKLHPVLKSPRLTAI